MATARLIQSSFSSLKSWIDPLTQSLFPNLSQQIRTATKKAGGSSNNGRDSAGRRLGVKVFPATRKYITAGSIIIRQRGTKFYPGENAGIGRDHTIYARIDGYVRFDPHENKKKRHVVHILPSLNTDVQPLEQL
jgi:large subunit ribosomal protein L27